MKERKIELLYGVIQDPSKKFITKDFFTEKDIDDIAQNVLSALKEKAVEKEGLQVENVVAILQPAQIMKILEKEDLGFSVKEIDNAERKYQLTWKDKDGVSQTDTLTFRELEPFVEKIIKAVWDKVSPGLPKDIIAHFGIKLQGHLLKLKDGNYFKPENLVNIPEIGQYENKDQIEAIKYLHSLPERSPYLFYGTEVADPSGRTINQPLNLTNLEAELSKPEPDFKKIFKYFIQSIEGHIFLLSNGLFLIDTKLDNIGINNDTDTAILFDLDGLRKKGHKTIYHVPDEYKPIERVASPPLTRLPITEANIIWETGINLYRIINKFYDTKEFRNNSQLREKISILKIQVEQMLDNNPEKRPALGKILTRIKEIIG
jgi:hypothetical protein